MKDVSRSFRKVGRLLARYAKTHNLDLDEIKRNAALTDPHPHEDQIENHPLVREADEYSKRIPPLLEQLEPAYDDERDETADRAAYMNVKRDVNTLKSIHDACEVLAWDWPLVRVKTRRVMNSWFEAADEAEEDYRKIHRHDAEMTADLIRRCLQRDKLALLSIYEWDEQFQDTAIELLARAEKLLRGIILYNGKP